VALAGDIGHDLRMRGRTKEMWWGIALEAPDPHKLASFYAQLLDWPLVDNQPNHAIVKPPQDSIYMMFQRVPDFVPPTWPGTPDRQRMTMHLDIEVEDLDAAVASAVTLGARVAEFQPNDNVRVLLDPAGHPFCFCRDDQ
jgi:predicted enzyme related to lactoylglutathione lyase